jgi:ketosteroid isomerase-like protein
MMNDQENLQTIHEVYAAFGRGDVPAVLNLLTEDVEWFTPGPPTIIPYAGSRSGSEQVAQYFKEFGQAVEITAFEPRQFFAQAEQVVVLGHYSGRVRTTGGVIESEWAHAFTLRNGKIANFHGYEDSAAVVAAFTPQPQAARAN